MGWRNVHIGRESDSVAIDGVRLWQQEWRWVEAKSVTLQNPLDPSDTLSCMVCEAGSPRRPVRFAAGKMPSKLWAFFVPY